jgi:hypothetical protein
MVVQVCTTPSTWEAKARRFWIPGQQYNEFEISLDYTVRRKGERERGRKDGGRERERRQMEFPYPKWQPQYTNFQVCWDLVRTQKRQTEWDQRRSGKIHQVFLETEVEDLSGSKFLVDSNFMWMTCQDPDLLWIVPEEVGAITQSQSLSLVNAESPFPRFPYWQFRQSVRFSHCC